MGKSWNYHQQTNVSSLSLKYPITCSVPYKIKRFSSPTQLSKNRKRSLYCDCQDSCESSRISALVTGLGCWYLSFLWFLMLFFIRSVDGNPIATVSETFPNFADNIYLVYLLSHLLSFKVHLCFCYGAFNLRWRMEIFISLLNEDFKSVNFKVSSTFTNSV